MNSITRTILTALMLLFFVGQVTASSAIACEMDLKISAQVSDEHQGHHGMNSDLGDKSDHDNCCDKSGNCTMSGCVAMAITTQDYGLSANFQLVTPISYQSLHIDLVSSSLYRPPILV